MNIPSNAGKVLSDQRKIEHKTCLCGTEFIGQTRKEKCDKCVTKERNARNYLKNKPFGEQK